MPRPHEAVISTREFWRVLAFVLIGFGAALALSWSIDAVVSRHVAAIGATVPHS
jgi:hypothetical protein